MFEGLHPSNTLFNFQVKFLNCFDFKVLFQFWIFCSKSASKWKLGKQHFFLIFCLFVRLKRDSSVCNPISLISLSFDKIRKILILTIFYWKFWYFSSDQKSLNIGQIAMNQNMEMESNTSTFCFRWINVKIPLFLRATLEQTPAELDLVPLISLRFFNAQMSLAPIARRKTKSVVTTLYLL